MLTVPRIKYSIWNIFLLTLMERNMPNSQINSDFTFTKEVFVVSLVNIGDPILGHATLVVEGVRTKDVGSFSEDELFIGQYDIVVEYEDSVLQNINPNRSGIIKEIRIFESNSYGKDYTQYRSESYLVDVDNVDRMLESIMEDHEIVEQSKQGICEPLLYQRLGKDHPWINLFSLNENGDNCMGWCLEKLAIAEVLESQNKLSKPRAIGGCILQ